MSGARRPQGPARELIAWFRSGARDLPWRGARRDPYRVLVSELMLQQTQVDRVGPRFTAFIERFPTLAALAAATEEEVLEAWSGLGYYSRARNLHRAARAVDLAGGELPRDVEALRRLPGVGPYTAAAVASLAFGAAEPVLDGNVLRVGSRALALDVAPRTAAGGRHLRAWVRGLMDELEGEAGPGEVNEALMELGATVCAPRRPRCGACPLATICRAHAAGREEAYPPAPRAGRAVEEQRWVAACCVDAEGRWLLARVDAGPLLRQLWLPPLDQSGAGPDPAAQARALVPGLCGAAAGEVLAPVRHSITYRRITVVPVRLDIGTDLAAPGEGWAWAAPAAPGRPTSSLLAKLAARVCGRRAGDGGKSR